MNSNTIVHDAKADIYWHKDIRLAESEGMTVLPVAFEHRSTLVLAVADTDREQMFIGQVEYPSESAGFARRTITNTNTAAVAEAMLFRKGQLRERDKTRRDMIDAVYPLEYQMETADIIRQSSLNIVMEAIRAIAS